MMNWFKFYGQDFLTDTKMSQLTIAERLMWVTILCLAHSEGKGGNISYCNESLLKAKMGLQDNDEAWKELDGFFDLFVELNMIQLTETGIFVTHFKERQDKQFTDAEKQARYRERKKKVTSVTHPKVTNVTLDKNRIEKNITIKENVKESKYKTLESLTEEDFDEISTSYKIPYNFVLLQFEQLRICLERLQWFARLPGAASQ